MIPNPLCIFLWCSHYLAPNGLNMIAQMKDQFLGLLQESGFVPEQPSIMRTLNRYSNNLALIKAIVCAGMYPHVAKATAGGGGGGKGGRRDRVTLSTRESLTGCLLHPSSVNARLKKLPDMFLTFFEAMRCVGCCDSSLLHPNH
jgi:ATP-dependent RNA helicase DHX36